MAFKDESLRRARQYAQQQGLAIADELGCGVHGIVLATESQPEKQGAIVRSAIKVHHREADYLRERAVYLRLQEHAVTSIRGCHVPRLLRWDDALFVVEMTLVSRPFVLDFAGALLDEKADFSPEVLADWTAEKTEQFGSRWAEVQAIIRALEGSGIMMLDVSPSNIALKR